MVTPFWKNDTDKLFDVYGTTERTDINCFVLAKDVTEAQYKAKQHMDKVIVLEDITGADHWALEEDIDTVILALWDNDVYEYDSGT